MTDTDSPETLWRDAVSVLTDAELQRRFQQIKRAESGLRVIVEIALPAMRAEMQKRGIE